MTGIEDSALDKGLYRWFLQMRSLGNPVSGPVLQEKVMVFNNLFNGPKDFHASNGWLHKWKKRHQIRQLNIAGERLSADEEGSANFSIQASVNLLEIIIIVEIRYTMLTRPV